MQVWAVCDIGHNLIVISGLVFRNPDRPILPQRLRVPPGPVPLHGALRAVLIVPLYLSRLLPSNFAIVAPEKQEGVALAHNNILHLRNEDTVVAGLLG